MIQSFYTGVTGMKAFQQGLSVTSNNLANAQTVGYKKQKAVFDDLLYKNTAGSQAIAGAPYASTSPTSIGSGAKMSGTSTDYTGGNLTITNGKTDAAIEGNGFFVLSDAQEDKTAGVNIEYTRKGTFRLSEDNYLVNDEGKYVLAYAVSTDGTTNRTTRQPIQINMDAANEEGALPIDYSITDNGYITVQYADGSFQSIGQLALATFPNEQGLMKTGNGNYKVAPAAGDPVEGVSGDNAFGTVRGGTTEASNVDLSAEFVDLMLFQKGFQGNSKAVKVSDDVLNDIINLIR